MYYKTNTLQSYGIFFNSPNIITGIIRKSCAERRRQNRKSFLGREDELGGCKETSVEILAEAAYKRTAEELIHPNAFTASLFECILADVPMMDVQGERPVGKLLYAYGIKCAGNRLDEVAATAQMTALYGAKAAVPLPEDIGAFLGAGHKRCDDIALEIDFKESLGLGRFASLGAHQRGICGIVPFKEFYLLFIQRSAAVPYDAAFTLAGLIITGEKLGENLL